MDNKYSIIGLITKGLVIFFAFLVTYMAITGGWLDDIEKFMELLIPILIFGILFLIKLKLAYNDSKLRKIGNNIRIVLYLDYFDKIKFDFIIYLTPIAIILIPKIMGSENSLANIIQALVVFLIMFFWEKYIFNKEE